MLTQRIPDIPTDLEPRLRRILVGMRNAIEELQGGLESAREISNMVVIPIAGANMIRWSRSNGDGYKVYSSDTSDISKAVVYVLGDVAEYTDQLAAGGVKKYYWIVAYIANKPDSAPIGPLSGTSLALGAATVLPPPPPPRDPYNKKGGYLPSPE